MPVLLRGRRRVYRWVGGIWIKGVIPKGTGLQLHSRFLNGLEVGARHERDMDIV